MPLGVETDRCLAEQIKPRRPDLDAARACEARAGCKVIYDNSGGDVIVIDADVVHAGWAAGDGQWKMRVAHVQPAALAAYCERLGIPRRERFDMPPEVLWLSHCKDGPLPRISADAVRELLETELRPWDLR